jgi:hypothetical protein
MNNFTFGNEENNLISSMNNYDEESNSSIILYKPLGEKIYIHKDNDKTIKDNENLNDHKKIDVYNNYIKASLFDNENTSFNYYNSSIFGKKNDDNYNNYLLNNETKENSNKNTGSNTSENIEKIESKAISSNNINQINDKVNNIENKTKKKVFYIKKEMRKNTIKFKVERKRGKRKPKNRKTETKPRSYNINLKFKGIMIDSIFKHVNKKLKRPKLKKLKYDIKRKDFIQLKKIKLKQIFENVSNKNNKDLEFNKKIIANIYKQKNTELITILELELFDVYYHILIEETDVLTGLRQEYESLRKKEILDKKTQNYIQGFEKVSAKYVKDLNN